MKIAVTGAGGFLGRGIVDELIAHNVSVVAVGNHIDSVNKSAYKISGDIFKMDDPFFEMGKPDVVLHLAWQDGFVHSSDAHLKNLNKHTIFLKKLLNSPLNKLSVMGTVHEIGFFEGSVNENTPANPQSEYGIAKNALRQYIKLYADKNKKKYQWLRAFYIVKADIIGNSIFSKLMRAESNGENKFPFTTGRNQNDFLEYDIFSRMVAETVIQDSVLGIINISSGYPQSLSDVVEKFIKKNKLNIKLDYGAYPDREYDSKAIWGNSSKIDKIMNKS